MARFGAFSICRESFVPLSPPRSRAGRILYRTRGGDGAHQHNRTPGPTCVEGAGGAWRAGPRCRGRPQSLVQTNFAHNFRRSFFETAQKRCNSNEVISMFEQVARELRAKLMRERPLGHQAGHLASRAGCRPPAQIAARPNKRNRMAPGTPVDVETRRPEYRRTSRTPAAPQQHVVSYNPKRARQRRNKRQGKEGLKDKKSWWRVSPSCFGGGLCGGGRARRWRRPIWG